MNMTLHPLIPFEPVRSDTIPAGEEWVYQIKWDGVRLLAYLERGEMRLFNRKKRERTFHYPEIADRFRSFCRAESVILDGEIIALGEDGKPSFHEVMRRDGLRRMELVPQMQAIVPVTYMVFDLLYLNGRRIVSKPLEERQHLLSEWIRPGEHLQLVANYRDGEKLFQVTKEQDMEGIVCKRRDSAYAVGGKDGRWVKVKNYGDILAAIGGFTLNGGIVNSVLLGLYGQEGRFYYIGHTGTGKLSKEEWRKLTELLRPKVIEEMPFVNRPERYKDAFWVEPAVCVKVRYSEWRWREGRSLRQPSIQSFVDVSPHECKFPF